MEGIIGSGAGAYIEDGQEDTALRAAAGGLEVEAEAVAVVPPSAQCRQLTGSTVVTPAPSAP